MRVALATCSRLPDLAPDDQPLAPALAARGVDVTLAVWDDPAVDWAAFDACVIRSAWDYHLRRDEFLAWAARVDAATHLLNPLRWVRWNSHKGYLKDLADRGIPTVPTEWLGPGDADRLGATLAARGWTDVVVKPAVSASAHGTARGGPADVADLATAVAGMADGALVQPFLRAVEGPGERALTWIDGAFTHAVRKRPAAMTSRGATEGPGAELVPAGEDELALAARVLATLDATPLYARVDVVALEGAGLALMELELIEPSLYLPQAPAATAAFAAAIVARL